MKHVLMSVVLTAGCAFAEDVTLTTSDGWELQGTYSAPDAKKASGRGVVLLHGLNGRRTDWKPVADKLAKAGHAVLAIDLRGHGKAKKDGKQASTKDFKDADYAAMVEDVRAAAEHLLGRKDAKIESIVLAGGGLGANLAVLFAASGTEVPVNGLILISPHLDDHGLKIDEVIGTVNTRTLLAACKGDHPGFEETTKLYESKHGKKEFLRYDKGLQGTQIMGTFSELVTEILRFVGE